MSVPVHKRCVCGLPPSDYTASCYSYNPIFDCYFGKRMILHTHYWCRCGRSWITVHDVS